MSAPNDVAPTAPTPAFHLPNQAHAEDSYFPLQPMEASTGRRRSSAAAYIEQRRASFNRIFNRTFNPPDSELIEPFSFVSTKTSIQSSVKLGLGILGQAGYTLGGVLLVDKLYAVASPPGVSPGVGSGPPPSMGPDGHLAYHSPSVGVSATIFAIGIACGLTSSALFLADGLKIAGNRKKAYAYVTMHVAGIVLISMSKFIVTWRKNHIPFSDYIALSLPAGIGRGIHWVTIPRSFSNSEIVHGDFAHLSFEQRQIMSEALRIVAAIFFGLWAASWSVQNYNPLEREGWGIIASLTLNVSAALPNTNLRRADIFRRSQISLLSPRLEQYQLSPRTAPQSVQSPTSPLPSFGTSLTETPRSDMPLFTRAQVQRTATAPAMVRGHTLPASRPPQPRIESDSASLKT